MTAMESNETRLRVLVADDEPIAREHICSLVAETKGLELIGAASDGGKALEIATIENPHIALLDIRMPNVQGTEVAAKIASSCSVIFTTAYDRYAVTAFTVGAVDYLLKPFGRERFMLAIDRAIQHLDSFKDTNREIDGNSPISAAQCAPSHFYLKDGGNIHRIEISTLAYVQGSGDYVLVCTQIARHFTRTRLAAFEKFLPAEQFIRIHRSTIVNVNHANKFTTLPNGRVCLHLKNGEKLYASREGARKLKDALSSKFATEIATTR